MAKLKSTNKYYLPTISRRTRRFAVQSNPKGSAGFTLIGVVISLFLAVLAVVLATQLLTRSESIVDVGREKFVATNLAREGLELVRQIRDNNWFSNGNKHAWLERGLCDDTTDTNHQITVDVNTAQSLANVGSDSQTQMFTNSSGIWTHTVVGNTPTVYHRLISIDCSQAEADPPNIAVTSTVSWQSRGQARDVVIKEKLFNWLP